MVNRPGFFTFYNPLMNAEHKKIPPMFVATLEGTLPEHVALRDRYNNLWQVKLNKIGDDWYIKDGWKEFVHDNMLQYGDMILFEYFFEGLFYFKVYGPYACEENRFGGHKYRRTEEQYQMIESDDDVVGDTDGNDFVPTTHEKKQTNDSPQAKQVADVGSSTTARRCNRKSDWYGEEIFKSGLIPQPANPYFVVKTRPNRLFELYIPMDVVKGYNFELPQKMMLVDPVGRKFHAERKVWKGGRVVYKGGWKSLCAMNSVGKDVSCICEFIKPKGAAMFLSVSFYRANTQQG